MKSENLFCAMNDLDLKLIEKAAPMGQVKKVNRTPWLRWASVAACFCLLGIIMVVAVYQIQNRADSGVPTIPPGIDSETNPPDLGVTPGIDGETPDSRPAGTQNSQDTLRPNVPLPYLAPLHYSGYDELIAAVKNGFADDFDRASIGDQYPYVVADFDRYVAELQEGGVPVPRFGDARVELRDRDGFSNISVFASEQYGLPWIWYYPSVPTGGNFYICVTVIPETVSEELKNGSASELIRALSPGSPNTDNYTESTTLERVYEREIALRGRLVISLKYEYKNDPRDYTIFIWDDLLVMACGDATIWDDEWFSKLSFERS